MREDLLLAMRWLMEGQEGCDAGDSLVFHSTGHSVQKLDATGDEVYGYNEALCPLDFEQRGKSRRGRRCSRRGSRCVRRRGAGDGAAAAGCALTGGVHGSAFPGAGSCATPPTVPAVRNDKSFYAIAYHSGSANILDI
ncbi:hypothetical protein E2562_000896 [Oryza meyeriana var. granulata]|uniref:Uncharacterized protein n=1 Tax=Oryza meyeriana var. granulata TaxID=110450 RepID=A0A6G1D039_9ORYZ|nr:hypothetical protein E2562_000896 [Oryza meyeriana var. granulata]